LNKIFKTNPAITSIPEEEASATGNVLSTPNSRLIGKTGIVNIPNIVKNINRAINTNILSNIKGLRKN